MVVDGDMIYPPVQALRALGWKAFFKRQSKNPDYLQDGDAVETHIGADDGTIDLGTQFAFDVRAEENNISALVQLV